MTMNVEPAETPSNTEIARTREAKVLELRKAGASFAQIAEATGYADEPAARRALGRALKRIGGPDAEIIRNTMVEQLNDIYRRTLEVYARKHPLVSAGGKIVKDPETNLALDDDGVKLQAVNTLLRVQERTSKLLGLDAPRAVELSGPGGDPIPLEVRKAELAERLRALPPITEDQAG